MKLEMNQIKLAMNFTDEFSRVGIFNQQYEKVGKGEKIDLSLLLREIQI